MLTIPTEVMDSTYLAVPATPAMVMASSSGFSQKHSFINTWNAIALSCLLAGGVRFLHPAAWSNIALFAGSQYSWIAALIAVCFVLNGIAAARIFLRIGMGRPSEICPADENEVVK